MDDSIDAEHFKAVRYRAFLTGNPSLEALENAKLTKCPADVMLILLVAKTQELHREVAIFGQMSTLEDWALAQEDPSAPKGRCNDFA